MPNGETKQLSVGSGDTPTEEMASVGNDLEVDVHEISPLAWRLLRTAAGYEQRGVEKKVDDLMQAHISMLENNNRSLSNDRLRLLFDLYIAELTAEQVQVIVEHF